MLATESRQVDFFDGAELVRPLPEGSVYALLAAHGERIVCDRNFADCYSAGQRRPRSRPRSWPSCCCCSTAPDSRTSRRWRRVAWHLRWKMALGLPVDHTGWHPTTLTKFRAPLLLHGEERLALENTLRLAEELGLLDAPAEQIVDSTPTWRRRHAGHRAAGALWGQEADRCGGEGLSRGRRRARARARVRLRAPEREARLAGGWGRSGSGC